MASREVAIVQRDLLRWWPYPISVTQPDELGGDAVKDWLGAKSKALSASWATEYQPWATYTVLSAERTLLNQTDVVPEAYGSYRQVMNNWKGEDGERKRG